MLIQCHQSNLINLIVILSAAKDLLFASAVKQQVLRCAQDDNSNK